MAALSLSLGLVYIFPVHVGLATSSDGRAKQTQGAFLANLVESAIAGLDRAIRLGLR